MSSILTPNNRGCENSDRDCNRQSQTDRVRLVTYEDCGEGFRGRTGGRCESVRESRAFSTFHFLKSPMVDHHYELVVRKDTGLSGGSWNGAKRLLEERSGHTLPYLSHHEAQEACWRYWGRESDSTIRIAEPRKGTSRTARDV